MIKRALMALSLFLLPCSSYGLDSANVLLAMAPGFGQAVVGKGSGDPCDDMGASGTYDHWWNGEYSGDTDKACQDSGVSTVDAEDATAGVIHADGAINGAIGALLNASGEHVRWAAHSQTIDSTGTVELTVATPANYTHNQTLFEIYTDNDNQIVGYHHDTTDRIYVMFEDAGDKNYHYTTAPAESTTVTILFSWDSPNDDLCIKIGEGAWDCIEITMDPWPGTVDHYSVGLDQNNLGQGGGTNVWKIDDVQFREGYEGT